MLRLIASAGFCLACIGIALLLRHAARRSARWAAELAAVAYIGLVAAVATLTGAGYILFPELGALSHDVFSRPHGRWARARVLLPVTPAMTAIIGTMITRHLPYGLPAILLSVVSAMLVIRAFRSPIAPAISAGLLPLVLDVRSWWYPPAVVFGTALLAAFGLVRARWFASAVPLPAPSAAASDIPAWRFSTITWIPFFVLFLVACYAGVVLTGWRFMLYPPLVVIAFEMLGRTAHCAWAHRPLLLPLVCFLSATGGMAALLLVGANPVGAAVSMGIGVAILEITDVHIPPVLAVALLPFVIHQPTLWYPVAVGLGTSIMVGCFLIYRRLLRSLENIAPMPANQPD